jgi:hypothetical protein
MNENPESSNYCGDDWIPGSPALRFGARNDEADDRCGLNGEAARIWSKSAMMRHVLLLTERTGDRDLGPTRNRE